MALEMTINFSERYRLQFGGEAFNVTNTPIRPVPASAIYSTPRAS
jgi:hypothetical protein